MGRTSARAMQIAVLSSAMCGLLQSLPDQPLKSQLIDLAAMCEAEATELVSELEFERVEPSGIKAA